MQRLHPVNQQGMSMVEAVIGSVLTAAILSMLYGGVTSISRVAKSNDTALARHAAQSDVLELLRADLEQSGRDGRIRVAPDGRSVSFERLEGATMNGGDLIGVWSPTITVRSTDDGDVVRESGGQSHVLARGIAELRFEYPNGARFVAITCSIDRDERRITRRLRVHPTN